MSSPDDKLSQPKGATEITLNNGTAWLLEDWVPRETELWWMKDNLRLALSIDGAIPTGDLINMANCVQ